MTRPTPFLASAVASVLAACSSTQTLVPQELPPPASAQPLELGNFSVSLTVADLAVSRAFYEQLGFVAVSGEPDAGWVVMQNGSCTIGLFQGMFERNMLTFNPGWDASKRTLADFQDVREIQSALDERGVALTLRVEEGTRGPGFLMLVDPDGNPILVDQHVGGPQE